jgi:hypothetical protein
MNKNVDVVHGIESSRNMLATDRPSFNPNAQNDAVLKAELKTLVLGVMRGNGIRVKPGDMSRKK